jgi:hypothetical protein
VCEGSRRSHSADDNDWSLGIRNGLSEFERASVAEKTIDDQSGPAVTEIEHIQQFRETRRRRPRAAVPQQDRAEPAHITVGAIAEVAEHVVTDAAVGQHARLCALNGWPAPCGAGAQAAPRIRLNLRSNQRGGR